MSGRPLCATCHGNGVVKIPGGIMTCVQCNGECYGPDPEIARLQRELEEARRERDSLRELLNIHHLGGWTDAEALIKERDTLRGLLERALVAHDEARATVKRYVDAERGGAYLVADADWATDARVLLAEIAQALGTPHA